MSIDKFESVCQELNNALQREQQAQQLLVEQSRQLEEITLRLDLYTTEGMEKEQTLSEAVHVSLREPVNQHNNQVCLSILTVCVYLFIL